MSFGEFAERVWRLHVSSTSDIKTQTKVMMWSIYEIIHIWTAVVDESEEWSSQLIFQFKQLERRRASTGFEPVTSAMPLRCSTNWAMKLHFGSEVNLLILSLLAFTGKSRSVAQWFFPFFLQHGNGVDILFEATKPFKQPSGEHFLERVSVIMPSRSGSKSQRLTTTTQTRILEKHHFTQTESLL